MTIAVMWGVTNPAFFFPIIAIQKETIYQKNALTNSVSKWLYFFFRISTWAVWLNSVALREVLCYILKEFLNQRTISRLHETEVECLKAGTSCTYFTG